MLLIPTKEENIYTTIIDPKDYEYNMYDEGCYIYDSIYVASELRYIRKPVYKIIEIKNVKSGEKLILEKC